MGGLAAPTLPLGLPLLPARRPAPALLARALEAGPDPDAVLRAWRAQRAAAAPVAARLDERWSTDEPELLDRADTPPALRREIIGALEQLHGLLRTVPLTTALLAPRVLRGRPRALEIAAGHGRFAVALERELRARRSDALVVSSDLEPDLARLGRLRARQAGADVRCCALDATRLAVAGDSFELAFNVLAMHHLPFAAVVAALREMRRVARCAVVLDLPRAAPLALAALPLFAALRWPWPPIHDGLVSLRRARSFAEWHLAVALAGWERARFGLLPPLFAVVHLDRD